MITVSTTRNDLDRSPDHRGAFVGDRSRTMLATLAVAILTAVAGCQTPQTNAPAETAAEHSDAIVLREGDVLKITFPGARISTTRNRSEETARLPCPWSARSSPPG